jgi:hypothetical protein
MRARIIAWLNVPTGGLLRVEVNVADMEDAKGARARRDFHRRLRKRRGREEEPAEGS